MSTVYWQAFAAAVLISLAATPTVRRFALAKGIVDHPSESRKIHDRPVAYLGGVAIYAAFVIPVLAFMQPTRQLAGLLLGISLLLVVGVIDDAKGLNPWTKLVWQIVAAGVTLAGGIGITSLTNPFGGTIALDWGRFPVELAGLSFHITPIANALSILWMVGLINAMNFLDGLDGLASGTSVISGFILFLLAVKVGQPEVALLSVILTGAALGFLPYNSYPAKIFMGDGGAYFLGLTLALLAIYSGGKLATAFLVLGFAILDSLWAVIRRLSARSSPFKADRQHLHHLLLAAGLSQRLAVLVLYLLSLAFGLVALAGNSLTKLITMVVLALLMVAITVTLLIVSWRKNKS